MHKIGCVTGSYATSQSNFLILEHRLRNLLKFYCFGRFPPNHGNLIFRFLSAGKVEIKFNLGNLTFTAGQRFKPLKMTLTFGFDATRV